MTSTLATRPTSHEPLKPARPRVAVVVLNWNGLPDTMACVESLLEVRYEPLDIVVVDNGSTGDDVDRLRARFGVRIRVVASRTNRGFSGGNNLGIRYSRETLRADHVLLLNNDTIVDPGFVEALVREAEARPDAGVLASKMYYHNPADRLWYAGGWFQMFGFHGHRRQGETDDGSPEACVETDYAPFASVLLTRAALDRVGLLCEDYFFLWEDLDYCALARRRGLRCYYVPDSRIWHKVGRSSGEGDWAYRKLWHGMRGRLTLRRRLLPRPLFLLYLALFALVLAPLHAAHYLLVRRDPRRVGAMLSGAWAGASGRPPPETRPAPPAALQSPAVSEGEQTFPDSTRQLIRWLVVSVLSAALVGLYVAVRLHGAVPVPLGLSLLVAAGAGACWALLGGKGKGVRGFGPLFVLFAALSSMSLISSEHLMGIDSPFGFASTRAIATWGWPLPPYLADSSVGTYAAFPVLDFAALMTQAMTGLPLESVIRVLPFFLGPLALLIFLALAFAVTPETEAVAGGALALTLTFNVFTFQRWFVRESIGFPLFLLGLWAFVRLFRAPEGAPPQRMDRRFVAVFVIAGLTVCIAHHLSSFALLALVGGLAATFALLGGERYRKRAGSAVSLAAGMAVLVLGYWFGGQVSALQDSLTATLDAVASFGFSSEATRQNHAPITAAPLRLQALLVVNLALGLLISGTVALGVLKGRLRKSVPIALFAGGIGLVLLARSTLYLGGVYLGFYRALSFVWPFLFIAFFLVLWRSRWGRRAAVATLAGFAAANVAFIPDYYLDHGVHGTDPFTDHRSVFSEPLVSASEWHALPEGFILGDDVVTVFFRGMKDHPVWEDLAIYSGNLEALKDAGVVAVRQGGSMDLPTHSLEAGPGPSVAVLVNARPGLQRVYDNGEVSFYLVPASPTAPAVPA